jgi:ligand-binding SRPBCC domain-containing protein
MKQVFESSFTVRAPLQAVSDFHHSPAALKQLTPPPVIVQFHHLEPVGEGSRAEFTMWFGPLPFRWLAIHSNVDPLHGFTDSQMLGPMKFWQHTHTFEMLEPNLCRIRDHVEFEYPSDLRGLVPRLLFSRPMLHLLFTYRKWVTQWALKKSS